MEPYIKNVTDITYLSELTPHPEIHSLIFCWLGEGLIRPNNPHTQRARKEIYGFLGVGLWAH